MPVGGRAITLIELLIVLAIALAIGALSLRGAVTWTEQDRIAAVESGLSSAALETRARALREQKPFELVAIKTDRGVFRVGMLTKSSLPRADGDVLDDSALAFDDVRESKLDVLYELPEPMRIGLDESGEAAQIESPDSEAIVLVRLMPDGSASLADTGWTLTQDDRVFVPSLAKWTARLTLSQREDELGSDVFAETPDKMDFEEVGP